MANLKTTDSIQEPAANKSIRLLSEDEYTQLTQLKRICEFWANIPAPTTVVQDEHVLGLVQTVLGLSSTTWRDIANEDGSATTDEDQEAEPEPEPENKSSRQKSIYARIAFNERTDLIGKKAPNHMAVRSKHLKDNPYSIPIDEYVECPECGKVGISGMKIDTNTERDFTDVWQRFRHEDRSCSVRIERIDEALEWDRVFARRIKYNKRHPSSDTLNSHMYPETEQVPEVEETIDQDANEIESEVTA